jgi:hypothetical protein
MSFTENLFLKRKMQELMEENSRLRHLIEMDVATTVDTPLVAATDAPEQASFIYPNSPPSQTLQPFGRTRRGENDAQGFPLEWLYDFHLLEQYLRQTYGDQPWILQLMEAIRQQARQMYHDGLMFPFWRRMYPDAFGPPGYYS